MVLCLDATCKPCLEVLSEPWLDASSVVSSLPCFDAVLGTSLVCHVVGVLVGRFDGVLIRDFIGPLVGEFAG